METVNVEEASGKVVGRRRASVDNYDRLVRAAQTIMPRLPFPKGVYKFRSFEEANQWTDQQIIRAAVKRNRERLSVKTWLESAESSTG